jgi:hypothetical protein
VRLIYGIVAAEIGADTSLIHTVGVFVEQMQSFVLPVEQ